MTPPQHLPGGGARGGLVVVQGGWREEQECGKLIKHVFFE